MQCQGFARGDKEKKTLWNGKFLICRLPRGPAVPFSYSLGLACAFSGVEKYIRYKEFNRQRGAQRNLQGGLGGERVGGRREGNRHLQAKRLQRKRAEKGEKWALCVSHPGSSPARFQSTSCIVFKVRNGRERAGPRARAPPVSLAVCVCRAAGSFWALWESWELVMSDSLGHLKVSSPGRVHRKFTRIY